MSDVQHEYYLDYMSYPIWLGRYVHKVIETRVEVRKTPAKETIVFMHLVEQVK